MTLTMKREHELRQATREVTQDAIDNGDPNVDIHEFTKRVNRKLMRDGIEIAEPLEMMGFLERLGKLEPEGETHA